MNNRILTLALCIGLCLAVGFAGSTFTPEPGSWYYTTLNKPEWNPPDWLFAPVWTVLFIMMGTALAKVLGAGWQKNEVKTGVALFAIQLILNLGWSASFFGMQSPMKALVVIALLWIFIVLTMFAFARVSKPASLLLAPYLAWVSFASFLNFTILQLNP
ncbi:tryptophan-rich sensory protein [Chlorobaculum thiosulfatiphilum]|uniref:Tryptophan-rich sensory protein n=1 Tax=Chlorobaculum thiosulfatiphilum TaxID=115852 RepID=A0A5C4S820_CHLTI|nr:TspO/MBR family protein [Chlorobaculum thiosulfatiphilum]TNJ39654.1 tryptophan-rich sensory protein [Chlorobaculum thiosulfatiphilum]